MWREQILWNGKFVLRDHESEKLGFKCEEIVTWEGF